MIGKNKSSYICDTNIIIRYLLNDNEELSKKANDFFDDVRIGAKKIVIMEAVFVECVYILLKLYQIPKINVVDSLTGLLHYKGVINNDRNILLKALEYFNNTNLHIVDSLLAAKCSIDNVQLISFDKDLNKFLNTLNN